jgi:hypothetical protein
VDIYIYICILFAYYHGKSIGIHDFYVIFMHFA